MVTMTQLGSRCTTNAAAVATALAGGTTTAEAQALGALLTILALRNDLCQPALVLLPPANGANLSNT